MELLSAIRNNDLFKIRDLLKKGHNPNELINENSLLSHTLDTQTPNLDIMRELLKYEANPNTIDNYGATFLMNIIYSYNSYSLKKDIVKLLLEYGANPNIQDCCGYTVLMFSINNGDIDLTKLLLEYGANPEQMSNLGDSALSLAQQTENEELINLIITKLNSVQQNQVNNNLKRRRFASLDC